MPIELYANNVSTTLASPITTTSETTIFVASAAGFPTAATGVSQFRILVSSEVMIVTNVSGTTWTVTRGAESTTPLTHLAGANVVHVVTAGAIRNLNADDLANGTVPFARIPVGVTNTTVSQGDHTHTQAQSHGSVDTDTAPTAIHHTLGTGANQAAAGNHTHVMPDTLPSGSMLMFGGSSAPTGYLLCQGQAVSRTTYATLYSALGGVSSPWGQGDGSTTFNIPDMRVRVPVGVGTGKSLGATDGVAEGSRNSQRTHSHSHSSSGSSDWGYASISASGGSTSTSTDFQSSHTHSLSITDPSMGFADTTTGGGSLRRLNSGQNHTHSGSSANSAGGHSHSVNSHSHTVSAFDNGHTHTIFTSVSSNTTPESPFAAVNYIIKT